MKHLGLSPDRPSETNHWQGCFVVKVINRDLRVLGEQTNGERGNCCKRKRISNMSEGWTLNKGNNNQNIVMIDLKLFA